MPYHIYNLTGRVVPLRDSMGTTDLFVFPIDTEEKATVVRKNGGFLNLPFKIEWTRQTMNPLQLHCCESYNFWPLVSEKIPKTVINSDDFIVGGLPEPQMNILYLVDKEVALVCQSRTDLLFPACPTDYGAYLELGTFRQREF